MYFFDEMTPTPLSPPALQGGIKMDCLCMIEL